MILVASFTFLQIERSGIRFLSLFIILPLMLRYRPPAAGLFLCISFTNVKEG